MRSAYFPMNSLGTLGRPGESLVPVVGQHGMRAGGNVPGGFSPDSECDQAQGYLYGAALSVGEAASLAQKD